MANIKSQIKRDRTSKAANAKNSAAKAEMRTAVKKVEAAIAAGNKEELVALTKAAASILDSISQDGVISKNSAARKKSHLDTAINAL